MQEQYNKQSDQEDEVQYQQSDNLPQIPDKLYFTIGEVGELCLLKPHVLRYWEHEFQQLRPNKRRGNRRYYQRKDVLMVRKIRNLLYDQGFTIEGARAKLTGDISSRNSTPGILNSKKFFHDIINSLESVVSELG